ncbi:OLC1v1005769C1 [Oldenlandia corymbosa var. corymbosa]|uniref:OLC1v1005769C1 n=1 Tax=Oldenlandia corymbosa var. corymbosa TaxID=529605 RepID=A0AAV1DHE5_OLDCO|nr:OLC1v1005769C1 [Oldenlandia corymbosa var. corymbosa]
MSDYNRPPPIFGFGSNNNQQPPPFSIPPPAADQACPMEICDEGPQQLNNTFMENHSINRASFQEIHSHQNQDFSLNKQFGIYEISVLISNQNDVGVALAKPIILEKMKENADCVFSPLSLNVLLSFVAAGAKGSTQHELLSFLKSTSLEQLNSLSAVLVNSVLVDGSRCGGPRLSFVNGAWVDQSLSFKPEFKNISDNVYKACSEQVDFAKHAEKVRAEVNNWVEKETNGLIKDLIPDNAVNNETRLILANALYFKGVWEQKFEASVTKEHDFLLLNGGTIKVPFMTSWKRQYISVYNGFKVLRLPYQQGQEMNRHFSMYIYLPDYKDGLQDLVQKVVSQSGFFKHHLPREKKLVGDFRIPKFKISYGIEASGVLKYLGLVLPFTEGLDDMVNCNLAVSQVYHKSFIEVNEQGTEAAAASAAVMSFGCAAVAVPEQVVDFVADHPFLFIITEDRTGSLLFMGSVVNPHTS